MKFMNLMLFAVLAVGVAGCHIKVTDKTQDKDVTREFLNQYAGKTEANANSNQRTDIRHSGDINHYVRVNKMCSLVVSGRINRAVKYSDGNFYGVTYRYDSVQASISTCFELNVDRCKLDRDECDRSIADYTKRTGDGWRTLLVSVGQDPKTVNFLP